MIEDDMREREKEIVNRMKFRDELNSFKSLEWLLVKQEEINILLKLVTLKWRF